MTDNEIRTRLLETLKREIEILRREVEVNRKWEAVMELPEWQKRGKYVN